MSWRHVEAAGLLEVKAPSVKAVLLALAHHTNAHSGSCYPSIERLMRFTSLSRRSVQTALRWLESEHLLRTVQTQGRQASLYFLHLPGVDPIDIGGAQPLHPRGATIAPKGRNQCAPIVREQESNDARTEPAPLPAGWKPPEDALEWAARSFQFVDVKAETALFVDNAAKKGETYADPVAAWRNWIRRGEEFAKRDARKEQSRAGASAGNRAGVNAFRQGADRTSRTPA